MTAALALYLVLTIAFATWATAHVLVTVALLLTRRIRLAALALVAVPVAPVLAYRSGHRLLAALWVLAALTYVVVRIGA